jgi:predicted  nucleic acid-binding Zn-ribbon protein
LLNSANPVISILTGMNELLQNLLKLQALEFGEATEKNAKAKISELRGKIPAQILAHYDRLVVRGKKGVAIVRDQVCTGCHMRLPIGVINTLMHGLDIQLCDSCGRYLLLDATPASVPAQPAEPVKPVKKGRKKKTPAADQS